MRQPSRSRKIGRQHVFVERRELRRRAILAGQGARRLRVLSLRRKELLLGGAIALLDVGDALREWVDDPRIEHHVHAERDRQRHDAAPVFAHDALKQRPVLQVASHAAPPRERTCP